MKIRNRIKELRQVKAAELAPNPKNWRTHPQAQQDALRGILSEVGYADALLARELEDGSLLLVDGHLRAETTPDETVPVLVLDLDEAEADKLLLSLDPLASLAETNAQALDSLLREIDTGSEGLSQMYADMATAADLYTDDEKPIEETEVPDVPETATTQIGDVWQLGQHRITCADCTDAEVVDKLRQDAVFDLCCTDPPYCSGGFNEIGKSAGSVGTSSTHKQIANDRLSTRGYQALLKQAFTNSRAPFLYAFTDWRMWVWLFDIAESCGYGVRQMIVWDKGTAGMGNGWRAQHELVLWAAKETPPFGNKYSGAGNVIPCSRTGNKNHTTEKPVELMAQLLQNLPFVKTVYDPFSGSGTTLMACEQIGLQCFGTELDPLYCDVIVQRWEQLTGGKAKRVNNG